MKMLCDEIFGEDNRVATLVWKKDTKEQKKNILLFVTSIS